MTQHRPRKHLGQHFLHDPNVIGRIIAAISPQITDAMVEIGPGLGAITYPLLARLQTLHVVEFDVAVIPLLRQGCEDTKRLIIHQEDALAFAFSSLVEPLDNAFALRVVGNLPYNISTPLLFHLLDSANLIKDMHFLLQKEVVDRLAAMPGGKDYGRLSVMVQYRCAVQALFRVGPGAFHPPPRVDSALVRLVPHQVLPHLAHDENLLANVVKQAFMQRRKTLRNALNSIAGTLTAMQASDIDPNMRAECLQVADFVRLANTLHDARQQ